MTKISTSVVLLMLLSITFDLSTSAADPTTKDKRKYKPTEIKIIKDKPIFTDDSLAEFDGVKVKALCDVILLMRNIA